MTREYKQLKQEIADLKEANKELRNRNIENEALRNSLSAFLGCEEDAISILTELKNVITESSFAQGERKQMARDLTSKDRLLRVINGDPIIEAEAEKLLEKEEFDEMGRIKNAPKNRIIANIYEL